MKKLINSPLKLLVFSSEESATAISVYMVLAA